jgi:hypothetical protein
LRPRRYVYELTESGRDLCAFLPMLNAWARRHTGNEPLLHDACGSALESVMWCPRCVLPATDNHEVVRWV